MEDHIRVFCSASTVPSVRQLLEWSMQQGHRLEIDAHFKDTALDSPNWTQVAFSYKESKSSFVCEIDEDSEADDGLVSEEVAYFEDLLSHIEDSPEKQRVLQHINITKYIVAAELPFDFDADGSVALNSLLSYFVRHYDGMVQVDGEGFYERGELIVKL